MKGSMRFSDCILFLPFAVPNERNHAYTDNKINQDVAADVQSGRICIVLYGSGYDIDIFFKRLWHIFGFIIYFIL